MERRKIEYISPTSLDMFYKRMEEFYLQRIAPIKIEKIPQTQPMSIGASFDAFVKSYLVNKLIDAEDQDGGPLLVRPRFISVLKTFDDGEKATELVPLNSEAEQRDALLQEFNIMTIFEKQVEEHNREWAMINGEHVFESYKLSGALTELTNMLLEGFEVSFESTIKNTISEKDFDGKVRTIPFLGKPDVMFKIINIKACDSSSQKRAFTKVLLDWKVNGYCSKSNTSPKPGYVICRDGWSVMEKKMSASHNKQHKKAHLMMMHSMAVNIAQFFELTDATWANQLAIYGWLCGIPVGEPFIAWVDQIVGKPTGMFPQLRIATHRAKISRDFQLEQWYKACVMWAALENKHYFIDCSPEESEERASTLDKQHEAFNGAPSWFKDMTRKDDYRG